MYIKAYFFNTIKILSKFQESSYEKIKYNLFGKYMFCMTLKDYFLEPKFLFFALKENFTLIIFFFTLP